MWSTRTRWLAAKHICCFMVRCVVCCFRLLFCCVVFIRSPTTERRLPGSNLLSNNAKASKQSKSKSQAKANANDMDESTDGEDGDADMTDENENERKKPARKRASKR